MTSTTMRPMRAYSLCGGRRVWTQSSRSSRSSPRELPACQTREGVEVALTGVCDDVGGQRRGRCVARPIPAGGVRREPVPHGLLVEAVLGLAGHEGLRVPEARRIGGEDLVAEDDGAVPVAAELELGVREDDPPLRGDRARPLEYLEREIAQQRGV